MKLTQIVEEDFANYKKTSMFLGTSKCDGKCWKELGLDGSICQNYSLNDTPPIDIPDELLVERYLGNPITRAVVIGGLEPLMDKKEILHFIETMRSKTEDDIVIYTGYYPHECWDFINEVKDKNYSNIIMKFGRYIPNSKSVFDEVLGVTLVSENQRGEYISNCKDMMAEK